VNWPLACTLQKTNKLNGYKSLALIWRIDEVAIHRGITGRQKRISGYWLYPVDYEEAVRMLFKEISNLDRAADSGRLARPSGARDRRGRYHRLATNAPAGRVARRRGGV
jgi:hypothetical protein